MEHVFSDLLRYDQILDDGDGNVFINKNGELMAVLKYQGHDKRAAEEAEKRVFDSQFNDAFMVFGTDWMIQVDAIHHGSTLYPETSTKNEKLLELEKVRRQVQEARGDRNTDVYFVITYGPRKTKGLLSKWLNRLIPSVIGGLAGLSKLFVEQDDVEADDWLVEIIRFREKVNEFSLKLPSQTGLNWLSAKEALAYLHVAIHSERIELEVPETGEGISDIMSDHMERGFDVYVGGSYKTVVGVVGYPIRCREIELELRRAGIDYKMSTRLIMLSESEALSILAKVRLGWARKVIGIKGALVSGDGKKPRSKSQEMMSELEENTGARTLAESVKKVEMMVGTAETNIAIYSLNVVVSDKAREEARRKGEEVKRVFTRLGFKAIVEEGNSVEAYLSTFPGEGYANIRRVPMMLTNVVNLLPVGEPYKGDENCPSDLIGKDRPPLALLTTSERSAFYFNLHDDDVGHCLMIGATGAGKSVGVSFIISQWLARYHDARVHLFDYGQSGRPLCQSIGGVYVNAADGVGIQILRRADSAREREFIVDWFMIYLEQMGYPAKDEWRVDLDEAARRVGRNEIEDRTIEAMRSQISGNIKLEEAIGSMQNGPLARLYRYVGATEMEAEFMLYEMRELMDYGDKYMLPILIYLFHEIEGSLDVKKPTLLIIEEAWGALGNSVWSDRLKQWLLTLRKKNAAVMLITHNISQWHDNETMRDVIGESCKTKILLPNAQAGEAITKIKYQRLGLTDATIDLIINGIPKREYVVVNSKGARKVQLGLSDTFLRTIKPVAEQVA